MEIGRNGAHWKLLDHFSHEIRGEKCACRVSGYDLWLAENEEQLKVRWTICSCSPVIDTSTLGAVTLMRSSGRLSVCLQMPFSGNELAYGVLVVRDANKGGRVSSSSFLN